MFRLDRPDERNAIPLAFLTVAMITVGIALSQSSFVRATLDCPLLLAPGRLVAMILTSLGITMLCHTCCTGMCL